ncbi:cocaine- and amphetamine-regulated transcript-like [Ictalurus punctatus]|uniref:Cocaine- and amphetamine-regulated transcript-like n=1 Tax=Ictalurus punctatus TaxID=7998 RepID=A0A2D0Q6W5_ICTPU|nr:cocaine- and amphetamine-regulated transcript-like [Ictalurus punctatus]
MESSGIVIGVLLITLSFIMCNGQHLPEISAEDLQNSDINPDKEMVEVLAELLSKVQNRFPSTEKRAIPACAVGSRCAMRFGPRFGQLCECGRGYHCNSYLLKCI